VPDRREKRPNAADVFEGDFTSRCSLRAMERRLILPRDLAARASVCWSCLGGVQFQRLFAGAAKLVEMSAWAGAIALGGTALGRGAATPRRLYVKSALAGCAGRAFIALAHITGGGSDRKPARFCLDNLGARIDLISWENCRVFKWMADVAGSLKAEMLNDIHPRCVALILCAS